jgi:hypothetical protein
MSVNKRVRDLINDYCSNDTSLFLTPSNKHRNSKGILNNDLYKSSETKINKSYLIYTSPNKVNRNKNINLLIPNNSLNYLVENSKIKREIDTMNRKLGIRTHKSLQFKNKKDLYSYTFNKEENKFGKFRNRPMLNLTNSTLNFSPKAILGNISISKNSVEHGIFKTSKKIKEKNVLDNTIIKHHYSIYDGKNFSIDKIKNIGRRDKQDFYNFMSEMGKYKQKKINQWRKQFLEDNQKY